MFFHKIQNFFQSYRAILILTCFWHYHPWALYDTHMTAYASLFWAPFNHPLTLYGRWQLEDNRELIVGKQGIKWDHKGPYKEGRQIWWTMKAKIWLLISTFKFVIIALSSDNQDSADLQQFKFSQTQLMDFSLLILLRKAKQTCGTSKWPRNNKDLLAFSSQSSAHSLAPRKDLNWQK